ncbi:transposase [Streptomyces sp. SA15]|uniref:transposase n=1 Tax=Streptomyces sp. SA15 TaxID=934019 RepID=UPI000D19FC1B
MHCLPGEWTDNRDRCRQAGCPTGSPSPPSPNWPSPCWSRACAAQAPFSWVPADAGYGRGPQLRAWCQGRKVPYMFGAPVPLPLHGPPGKPRRPAVKRADDLFHCAKPVTAGMPLLQRRRRGRAPLRLDGLRRAGQRRQPGRRLHAPTPPWSPDAHATAASTRARRWRLDGLHRPRMSTSRRSSRYVYRDSLHRPPRRLGRTADDRGSTADPRRPTCLVRRTARQGGRVSYRDVLLPGWISPLFGPTPACEGRKSSISR